MSEKKKKKKKEGRKQSPIQQTRSKTTSVQGYEVGREL
jgi:hypothetical protein